MPCTGLEATYSQLAGTSLRAAGLGRSAISHKEASCGLQPSARTKCPKDNAHYQTQPPTPRQKKPQWTTRPTEMYAPVRIATKSNNCYGRPEDWVSRCAKLTLYHFWKELHHPPPRRLKSMPGPVSVRGKSKLHINLPDQLSLIPGMYKSPIQHLTSVILALLWEMGVRNRRISRKLVGWVTWSAKIGRNSKRDPASTR